MEEESEDRLAIKDLANPITYFLAGGFLIANILKLQPPDGAMQLMDYFTCVVGGFLLLSGVVFALVDLLLMANLKLKCLTKFREKIGPKFDKYVRPTAFVVAIATVVLTTVDFANYPPLFYIGFVFLLVILLQIIFSIRDIRKLLVLTAVFIGIAIYNLWTGADKTNLTFILSLGILAIYLTLKRFTETTGR